MTRIFQYGRNKVVSFNKESKMRKLILRPKKHSRSRYSAYEDRLVLIIHKNGDVLLTQKVLDELGHPKYVAVGLSEDGEYLGVCAMDEVAGRGGYGWTLPEYSSSNKAIRVNCNSIVGGTRFHKEDSVYAWGAYKEIQDGVLYIATDVTQVPSLV